MGALDDNHRVIWPYAVGDKAVPSGWSTDTEFDDRYIVGLDIGTSAGDTAGAANHTHTISDHNHTSAGHTHGQSADSQTATTSNWQYLDPAISADPTPDVTHSHTTGQCAVQNSETYTTATGLSTSATANAKPASVRCKIIKPDAATTPDIPVDGVGFLDQSSIPTGWAKADGTKGAAYPDMNNRFVWGETTGSLSGTLTSDADVNHGHPSSASHTHNPPGSHTHLGLFTAEATGTDLYDFTGFSIGSSRAWNTAGPTKAHHKVALNATTPGATSATTIPITNISAHHYATKWMPVFNDSGAAATPDEIILPYMADSPPQGWISVDPGHRLIKCTTTTSEIGDISGGVHQHATSSHTHTGASHTHTGGTQQHAGFPWGALSPTTARPIRNAHGHVWTHAAASDVINSTSVGNTGRAENLYHARRVLWVKKKGDPITILGKSKIGKSEIAAG